MDEAVSVRALSPGDADAVAALVRLAFATHPVPVDPPPSALRVSAQELVEHLRAGAGAVAVAGRAIVGSALWSDQDGGLYLGRLAVHPEWRRRGIAKRLVEAAEQAGRERGLAFVHLGTRLVLADNLRLFSGCGFVETTRHAHAGFNEPTWIRMEKRLT